MTAPGFERSPPAGGPLVRGFSAQGFLIEGEAWPAALLTPERAAAWDAPPLHRLAPDHVEWALGTDPAPEFLILGTGGRHSFAPRAFAAALEARGIGVEAMDSRAAARTWGMLRGEGHWIAAALMPL
jgi:uncharacterized protein